MAENATLFFYVVYKFMWADLRLRCAELQVFAILYGYAKNHYGIAEVSFTRLQQLSGYTRETISKCIASLLTREYIKKQDAKGYRKINRYVITADCPSPTSPEIGLVRNSDQSDKSNDQSENQTSSSKKIKPHYNNINTGSSNNKRTKERNIEQLNITENHDFKGRSTI